MRACYAGEGDVSLPFCLLVQLAHVGEIRGQNCTIGYPRGGSNLVFVGNGGLARPSSMHATCVFPILIAPSMGHQPTHLASVTLTGRMNSSSV